MDSKTEYDFIKKYIVKNKQDRIQYELSNKNKRIDGICRFCHRTPDLVKAAMIFYRGYNVSVLQKYIGASREEQCYVISFDNTIDGTWQRSEIIFSRIVGMGMPSIAIFKNFSVIETEQVQGPAEKFILKS